MPDDIPFTVFVGLGDSVRRTFFGFLGRGVLGLRVGDMWDTCREAFSSVSAALLKVKYFGFGIGFGLGVWRREAFGWWGFVAV